MAVHGHTRIASRLFADDYSSSGQLAWRCGERGTGAEYWIDDYLGQLRFDSLLSPTLVIPDSHVFDGVYFLTTTPSELHANLGRAGLRDRQRPAIEIRARQATLEDSLAVLLRREDHPTLNAFRFKAIGLDRSARLAEELGRTPETELDRALSGARSVPEGVASLLERCLVRVEPDVDASGSIEPLRRGWERWLAEEEHLVVKAWPTFSDFDLVAQIGREGTIDRELRGAVALDALGSIRRLLAVGSGHRADASAILARYRAAADDEATLRELELVDVWYSRLRYRALAARHGCHCALADRPWLPAVGAGQALLRELIDGGAPVQVPLPDDVLTALGDLPAEDFEQLVHANRRWIVRLWTSRSVADLDAVADGIAAAPREAGVRSLGIAEGLPAAGGVMGALLGGVGGPLGVFIGTAAKGALERRENEPERIRLRVQEAAIHRAGSGGNAT